MQGQGIRHVFHEIYGGSISTLIAIKDIEKCTKYAYNHQKPATFGLLTHKSGFVSILVSIYVLI